MTNIIETRQGKRASAKRTEKFIFIATYSGRGLLAMDADGAGHVLSVDASDDELGVAVLDAIERSRFLQPEEARRFLSPDQVKKNHDDWIKEMLNLFSYTSRRDLFRGMKSCDIRLVDGEIVICPTEHPKLEAWEVLGDEMMIRVSGGASSSEIGAVLRTGFDRCSF